MYCTDLKPILRQGLTMSYEEKPHHRRYYMLSEVAQHCTPEDCWLTWFGDIYDLSPLLHQHQGETWNI